MIQYCIVLPGSREHGLITFIYFSLSYIRAFSRLLFDLHEVESPLFSILFLEEGIDTGKPKIQDFNLHRIGSIGVNDNSYAFSSPNPSQGPITMFIRVLSPSPVV